jgi:hypothetical protein
MMRLGALVEAVTIEMNMEDWVADWNDKNQTKGFVSYDHEDNKYVESYFLRTNRLAGVIYVSKEVAKRVCEILNNKEYELKDN